MARRGRLKIATWNINSVRLRLERVRELLDSEQPDILCLQETKCPDDRFPLKDLTKAGYPHIAILGQKGYHGVAILSKRPFSDSASRGFCDKGDARHISITLGSEAGLATPLDIHCFYVPAGGDIPDPDVNDKFAHKLAFLDEMEHWDALRVATSGRRALLLGDLNIAPLKEDVWGHRELLNVVSHTPVETEKLTAIQEIGGWIDTMRHFVPADQKLYTWWSYRAADWQASNRGRRLDHIWSSPNLRDGLQAMNVRSEARGWERPSDHAPVSLTLDV